MWPYQQIREWKSKKGKEKQVLRPCLGAEKTLECKGGRDTICNSKSEGESKLQIIKLLWSTRILRKILETRCYSDSREIPPTYNDVKNLQGVQKITRDNIL